MTLRFWKTDVDATVVGIPLLDIGSDLSMDEPSVVIRVAGRDEAGGALFDHTALSLMRGETRTLINALDLALAREANTATVAEMRAMLKRLTQLRQLQDMHGRVNAIVGQLGEGEAFWLSDEGTTKIECRCEHPPIYSVYRWGDLVQGDLPPDRAVDLALGDRGLPYTDPIVGTVPVDPTQSRTWARSLTEEIRLAEHNWRGIVSALNGSPGPGEARVIHTGGGCLAIEVRWENDSDAYALLTGDEPLGPNRSEHQSDGWRLTYYVDAEDDGLSFPIGLNAGEARDDARAALLVDALLFGGLTEKVDAQQLRRLGFRD